MRRPLVSSLIAFLGPPAWTLARSRSVCLILAVLSLSACQEHVRRDGQQLVRYRGPVRLVLTAALVAPGKDSGLPWDGPGSLPPDVSAGLRAVRPRSMAGTLFRALAEGTGLGALAKLLPWTANAFISGIAAPDVQVEIFLNGALLQRSPKVANSYYPTWSGVYTPAVEIHDFDQLELRAVDRDVLFHDQIGVCTSQGMPWVDGYGYASGLTFQCLGQLWAVALRVVPANLAAGQQPEMEIAPLDSGDSGDKGE